MTLHLGNVPAGSTLYIPFASYDADGASVTLSGLAVTDIEIYKNGSVTQRASDAGYALLDTDGIDFDGVTGLNGFSIDLSDDTDSGFYSVGGFYWVVVASVTIATQAVNFIAATFRIVPAEASAGVPDVNVASIDADAITASAIADNAIDAGAIAANAITSAKIATDAIGSDQLAASAIAEINATVDAALADYDGPTHAELVSEIDDVQTDIAALNNLSAAEVNAEVVDVLSVDAFAEPTGVPPATDTLAGKIGRLHMALRNRIDVTASKKQFYDDAGNVEWEKDLSDDGTTYSETEGNAP